MRLISRFHGFKSTLTPRVWHSSDQIYRIPSFPMYPHTFVHLNVLRAEWAYCIQRSGLWWVGKCFTVLAYLLVLAMTGILSAPPGSHSGKSDGRNIPSFLPCPLGVPEGTMRSSCRQTRSLVLCIDFVTKGFWGISQLLGFWEVCLQILSDPLV